MKASKAVKHDTKWVFLKKGTCSRTLFYILNREFGNPKEPEEKAIDPMAVGILQNGYQCGQIWGGSMAVGTEAYPRYKDDSIVTKVSIDTTKELVNSFKEFYNTIECEDIIGTKVANGKDALKLMVTGKFLKCFKLADRWAPKAIEIAKNGLDKQPETDNHEKCVSCASLVVKKMGGTDEQAAMVSGFAGGLGLSGSGCGALSAAVWMATYKYEQLHGKSTYPCPDATKVLQSLLEATDYEFECRNITGKTFNNTCDHTDFINNGGCGELINRLSQTQ